MVFTSTYHYFFFYPVSYFKLKTGANAKSWSEDL